MGELILRELDHSDEREFLAVKAEFAADDPDWPFALGYDSADGFADYVERTRVWPRGERLPEKFVRSAFLVAVVDGRIVGRVSLRFELNAFLAERGGHIGYGVAPSARRRGYATETLRRALQIAKAAGLDRVLVTCDAVNEASRRVIEANGGILENVLPSTAETPELRRYWIDLVSADVDGGRCGS